MARLLHFLLSIVLNQGKIMSALTDIQTQAAANSAAIAKAVTTIQTQATTIATQAATIADLQAQVADAAALQAVTTQMATDDSNLEAAVAAAAPAA